MENNFAKNLLKLRIERQIGQIELSEAIQVSQGTISFWEHQVKEPTLTSLLAVADYFQVTLDELVVSDY